MAEKRVDLARIVLEILFLAALILSSLWILSPLLPAFIWAVTLVIATWPLMSVRLPANAAAPHSMNQPWLTINDWPVRALVLDAAKNSAAAQCPRTW
jgi:hypothetical protein